MRHLPLLLALPLLASCGERRPDPRGVDRDETVLTVSATGRADTRPDEARIRLGVNSKGPTAAEASRLNREKMAKVAAALKALGTPDDAMQTQNLSLQRTDYGPERGTFRAENMLEVRLSDMNKVGEAVAAVTDAGANVVGGPDLRVSDREAGNRSAYAQAYKAARARAEAYAGAADLKVARVLAITDGGEYGVPMPYGRAMEANMSTQVSAPPPMVSPPPPPFSPGMNSTEVRVRVDFALEPK
jgi:uncharacterized protein YggE